MVDYRVVLAGVIVEHLFIGSMWYNVVMQNRQGRAGRPKEK
jgi:hypothetical protein